MRDHFNPPPTPRRCPGPPVRRGWFEGSQGAAAGGGSASQPSRSGSEATGRCEFTGRRRKRGRFDVSLCTLLRFLPLVRLWCRLQMWGSRGCVKQTVQLMEKQEQSLFWTVRTTLKHGAKILFKCFTFHGGGGYSATGGRCDVLAPLYWNFSLSSLKVRGMRPYKMDLLKVLWLRASL